MHEPPDTTAELKRLAPGLARMPRWLRENFTTAGAWTLMGIVFGCGVSWAYLSSRLDRLEDAVQRQSDQSKQLAAIDKAVGVLDTKLDDLSQRVQEQQEKWSKVEQVAELPVRRRK